MKLLEDIIVALVLLVVMAIAVLLTSPLSEDGGLILRLTR